MNIPTDPKLTKLRIIAKREQEKLYKQKELADKAWLDYIEYCNKLGYCPNCEKLISECTCVLLANNYQASR